MLPLSSDSKAKLEQQYSREVQRRISSDIFRWELACEKAILALGF